MIAFIRKLKLNKLEKKLQIIRFYENIKYNKKTLSI